MTEPSEGSVLDADLLAMMVDDLERDFAELLTLMAHSLGADPEEQVTEASAFQHRISELQCKTEAGLKSLQSMMHPWSERRRQAPPELAVRVDRFLELLVSGLKSIGRQVEYRVEDICKRRAAIADALESLSKQRKGVQGYRQKKDSSKIIRGKA